MRSCTAKFGWVLSFTCSVVGMSILLCSLLFMEALCDKCLAIVLTFTKHAAAGDYHSTQWSSLFREALQKTGVNIKPIFLAIERPSKCRFSPFWNGISKKLVWKPWPSQVNGPVPSLPSLQQGQLVIFPSNLCSNLSKFHHKMSKFHHSSIIPS